MSREMSPRLARLAELLAERATGASDDPYRLMGMCVERASLLSDYHAGQYLWSVARTGYGRNLNDRTTQTCINVMNFLKSTKL